MTTLMHRFSRRQPIPQLQNDIAVPALCKRSNGKLAGVFTTALLLGGCSTVGPNFKQPEVTWLDDWQGGSLQAIDVVPANKDNSQVEQWWHHFNDPILNSLVEQSLRLNPDVRVAGLRIMEARAQLGIAGSSLYPQVKQISADVIRAGEQQSDGPDVALTNAGAGFGIGWEIDFWGKFRRSIEAADANYFASIAAYDNIQVLMAAQVASAYSSIRTLENKLHIAQENAALQKRSLQITERLFKSGNESELDMQQARSQYFSTLATIPDIQASIRQTQNALSILLARAPGPLPEMAAGTQQIPVADINIIVDIPANMLRQRPDVRASEMRLAAQSALIGVSFADLYPSITLLGSIGISATSLGNSSNALSWGVGPSLVWNIFDQGRLNNQILVQDARFQQLYEQYQALVLQAAREVDNAAVGIAKNKAQIPLLTESEIAAKRSLDIATIQHREGLVDFERVLDSQRALFNQQERLVNSRGEATQDLINLYKAMGGGWQQGRLRPILDDKTRAMMLQRSAWKNILSAPLPEPESNPNSNATKTEK